MIRPRLNIRSVTGTGAQTVSVTDDVVVWMPGTSAATTFTLPSSPRVGEVHGFKYFVPGGSVALTIAAPAGQTIDGQASINLATPYAYLQVAYIGSNQWVIA
jgi:hypothetical protein